MKARGKREAQRNASPLVRKKYFEQSTESAKYQRQLFRSFRASRSLRELTRGDAPHVVRRLPLAIIFRAFGAGRLPLAFIFRAFGAQFRLFVQSRFAVFRVRYYSQPLIDVSTSFNTDREERTDFSTSRSLAASKVLSAKAREWKLWVATR